MSHFTVVVIGQNIDEQMAPYAEQGFDEKYAVFQKVEEESLQEYLNNDVEIVVLADGSKHTKYAEQFRKFDVKSMNTDYIYPEGSVIRKGSFNELYSTFDDFMNGWHGHSERDEKTGFYGYWNNPNAKFDHYGLGGRWSGYFKTKAGVKAEVGSSGAFGNKPKAGWSDSIRLCDIDIEGMFQASIHEANKTYDQLELILDGRPMPSWNAVREKHGENIEAARTEYNSMPTVKDLNKAQFYTWGDLVETFCNSREEYVEKCKNKTMVPFAVVKDGKWYQKGEMGWFGMSNDEMTQDEWNKQFWEMLKELPDETQLSLLDCHI